MKALSSKHSQTLSGLSLTTGRPMEQMPLLRASKSLPPFPFGMNGSRTAGRHTALNLGVKLAAGEFIMILDSDDRCTPDALQCLDLHWKQIPNPDKFSTLVCLCKTPDGKLVGKPFPSDVMDGHTFAEQLRIGVTRTGSAINRVDALIEFPFPEGSVAYRTRSILEEDGKELFL